MLPRFPLSKIRIRSKYSDGLFFQFLYFSFFGNLLDSLFSVEGVVGFVLSGFFLIRAFLNLVSSFSTFKTSSLCHHSLLVIGPLHGVDALGGRWIATDGFRGLLEGVIASIVGVIGFSLVGQVGSWLRNIFLFLGEVLVMVSLYDP